MKKLLSIIFVQFLNLTIGININPKIHVTDNASVLSIFLVRIIPKYNGDYFEIEFVYDQEITIT